MKNELIKEIKVEDEMNFVNEDVIQIIETGVTDRCSFMPNKPLLPSTARKLVVVSRYRCRPTLSKVIKTLPSLGLSIGFPLQRTALQIRLLVP